MILPVMSVLLAHSAPLFSCTLQQSIPAPPPPTKFISPDDIVTLEDESGRIKLVGPYITTARLVTGVVIGVLGMETPEGAFEVVDICYGGMAPQTISDPPAPLKEERMDVDGGAFLILITIARC